MPRVCRCEARSVRALSASDGPAALQAAPGLVCGFQGLRPWLHSWASLRPRSGGSVTARRAARTAPLCCGVPERSSHSPIECVFPDAVAQRAHGRPVRSPLTAMRPSRGAGRYGYAGGCWRTRRYQPRSGVSVQPTARAVGCVQPDSAQPWKGDTSPRSTVRAALFRPFRGWALRRRDSHG